MLTVAALAAAVMISVAARAPMLRAVGWALVAEDRLEPSDIIVVAWDADGAGVLEAADLVRDGIASRVAIFADPPDAVDREFLRRGIPYEDAAARSVRQLTSLGVTRIEQIPRGVSGTEREAALIAAWCNEHRVRSIIVVSMADHSRRLHRMLRRAMQGHDTRVAVRRARYAAFDPDRWWETRGGVRIVVIEMQKLLLDIIRHPIP